MKSIYKKRLLKLAEHLESGKLGHEKFDFSVINCVKGPGGMIVPAKNGDCGTLGCALGECPIAFPRTWQFRDGDPRLKNGTGTVYGTWGDANLFFDLDYRESSHLFAPNDQDVKAFGGKRLSHKAKPKQVASNIRAFIKKKEADAKQS